MKTADQQHQWTNDKHRDALHASTGLQSAVLRIVGGLDGVKEIRVLHRDEKVSKFFVILESASLETIDCVVGAMVQLEDFFRGSDRDRFDYDTVPADRLALVPSEATTLRND